jgi:ornithine carbamoyltransferase
MVDAIMIRTNDHAKIENWRLCQRAGDQRAYRPRTRARSWPICWRWWNAASRWKGMEMAWLGDGNNVLHSLIEAAGLLGFAIRAGGPAGYEPDAGFVERARALARASASPTMRRKRRAARRWW